MARAARSADLAQKRGQLGASSLPAFSQGLRATSPGPGCPKALPRSVLQALAAPCWSRSAPTCWEPAHVGKAASEGCRPAACMEAWLTRPCRRLTPEPRGAALSAGKAGSRAPQGSNLRVQTGSPRQSEGRWVPACLRPASRGPQACFWPLSSSLQAEAHWGVSELLLDDALKRLILMKKSFICHPVFRTQVWKEFSQATRALGSVFAGGKCKAVRHAQRCPHWVWG